MLRHVAGQRRFLPTLAAAVAAAAFAAAPAAPALAATAAKPSAHAARHHHRSARLSAASTQAVGAACSDATLMPSPSNLDRIAAATLCLVNRQRAAQGLSALRADAALDRAAVGHSQDMVAQGYFGHTSPSGSDPLSRMRSVGYVRQSFNVGENIAAATGSYATPAAIVNMWMHSAEHRANILTAGFRDSGMGVAYGAPTIGSGPGATYTQDFGSTS